MKKTYIKPALDLDEQMLEQDILTQSVGIDSTPVKADNAAGRGNIDLWDDEEEE